MHCWNCKKEITQCICDYTTACPYKLEPKEVCPDCDNSECSQGDIPCPTCQGKKPTPPGKLVDEIAKFLQGYWGTTI